MGEPPGQPKLLSRQSQTPGWRVGREAPWKGSIELLGSQLLAARYSRYLAEFDLLASDSDDLEPLVFRNGEE